MFFCNWPVKTLISVQLMICDRFSKLQHLTNQNSLWRKSASNLNSAVCCKFIHHKILIKAYRVRIRDTYFFYLLFKKNSISIAIIIVYIFLINGWVYLYNP